MTVIHMFAFRWHMEATEADKDRAVREITALQGVIPGLLETWVGRTASERAQGYELGGAMKFADQLALDAYGDHPAHRALLDWLVPLIDPIEIDFVQ